MSPLQKTLTLVGVVHLDVEGHDRLKDLLGYLRPGLITLQISPYAVKIRRRRGAELRAGLESNLAQAARLAGVPIDLARRHGAIAALETQIDLPFEFVAAREYARANHARIRLVDDSGLSRRFFRQLATEAISPENLTALLAAPDESLAVRSRRARREGTWVRQGMPVTKKPPPERDDFLAEAIARAHRRFHPRLHLHVCGWRHLGPLLTRLAGFSPNTRLLWQDEPADSSSPQYS